MEYPTDNSKSPENTTICTDCEQDPTPSNKIPVTITVSRIAIASTVFALSPFMILCLMYMSYPYSADLTSLAYSLCVMILPTLALISGIISFILMSGTGGRLVGKGYAATGIVLPLIIFGSFILSGLPLIPRCTAFRMTCGTNLSGNGKAMLIYANDYDDKLPQAGGKTNIWTHSLPTWNGKSHDEAYSINPDTNQGLVTATSSLYLLVKYCDVTPKQFVCKQEAGTMEFKLANIKQKLPHDFQLTDAWDFGPTPDKHCSYSYHWPFDEYGLSTSSDPNLVVAADRNPWFAPIRDKGKNVWEHFLPDNNQWHGTVDSAKLGNTNSHYSDGQNVLFLDGHVMFKNRSFCGFDNDNIYTPAQNQNSPLKSTKGLRPVRFDMSPTNRPKSKTDSYLVH